MISGPTNILGPSSPCGLIPAQTESQVSLKPGDVVKVIQACDARPKSGYLTFVVGECLSVSYVGDIGDYSGWLFADKIPRTDTGVPGWAKAEHVTLLGTPGQSITL